MTKEMATYHAQELISKINLMRHKNEKEFPGLDVMLTLKDIPLEVINEVGELLKEKVCEPKDVFPRYNFMKRFSPKFAILLTTPEYKAVETFKTFVPIS